MPNTVIKNILENRFLYSTCLLAISMFLGQAALSIAFVLWVMMIPFRSIKTIRVSNLPEKLIFLPVLYGLMGIIISLLLYKESGQLKDLLKYLPFIFIPVGMLLNKMVYKDYSKIRILYLVFISTATLTFSVSIIYGVFRLLVTGNSIYITYNHLSEIFGVQPIYLALFYLVAILLAIDMYFKETEYRKAYLLVTVPLFIGIVLLASRSSLLIAILIFLSRIFIAIKNKRRLTLILLGTIAAVLTLIVSIPTLQNRFVNFEQNLTSYSGTNFRAKIWENTLEVGLQSPIWGYGYSNSQSFLQQQYKKVNFRRALLGEMNAHNQYLQTFIDNGIIGLTILILMIFMPFSIKRQSFTAIAFWLIIAIALITESFFRRQFGVILYSLFYSLFMISLPDKIDLNSKRKTPIQ